MRSRFTGILFAWLLILSPQLAHAQDFGVTESAETIDRGTSKIKVSPLLIFGKNGGDDNWGLTLLAGYGFTDRVDVEGGVAIYDGGTAIGGNVEFWLAKGKAIDVSFIPGLHVIRGENVVHSTGIDLTFLASGHASPRAEPYVGFDVTFERFGDNLPGADFKTVHLVPGLEYKVTEDIDFDVEVGLALNDESRHYFSAGLTFYFR